MEKLKVNGQEIKCEKYNIDGNNYFKLRDLGSKLGFNVDWDPATSTVLVTSK